MSAVDAIRKFIWPIVGIEVVAVVAMLAGLLAVQRPSAQASILGMVYVAGFVATLAWLPICYLLWFGRPNLPALTGFHRAVFWLAACLLCVFWLRVVAYALAR